MIRGTFSNAPDVSFTVDGQKITAPAGTLLIDACKTAGIEIPAFCYYPGLSLQAACRMCVVRQEKVGKLQTACTTVVAEGQVFLTETDEIKQARKATLELLLGNHPLDCPVCDSRRRVRTPGHDLQIRRIRIAVHRNQAAQGRAAVVAGGLLRPATLHSLLPLCPHVRRGHGRLGARRTEPRRHQRHRSQWGRPPGLRRVRSLHRHLLRVGALTSRHLSLQDPSLGDEPRRHRMHPLRRRLQRPRWACAAPDEGMEIVRGDNRDKSGIEWRFPLH